MNIIKHSEIIECKDTRPDGTIVEWTYREPAIGECLYCGKEVILSGFTNTCECGADYNSSGQLLGPRSCWGEETGESVADILMVDANGGFYED